jgi:hypothetical protein
VLRGGELVEIALGLTPTTLACLTVEVPRHAIRSKPSETLTEALPYTYIAYGKHLYFVQ